MNKNFSSVNKNLYDDKCPILYAMEILGSKWKLPIIWYLVEADNKTLRYNELQRRIGGVTSTMLTKCLKELERDRLITRKQYNTIPPTVEYSLTKTGEALIPALDTLTAWAESQMSDRKHNQKEDEQ